MNSTMIRLVVMLGTVAVIGILAMQTYWVISMWNVNEEEFNNKVNLALYRVATTLADLNDANLPTRDIVRQRTSNYYVVNIEDEIEADILEYLLQREFEALSLNINFEYAIYDCYTNQMVYGGYCTYAPDGDTRDLKLGDLPRDSEFLYYFGVKFPTRTGYLLDKMQLSIFLSIILLITVIFFAYAMYVILRQKRLSDMQKDFINNMTHEFKTPLATIRIAAGVFRNDERIRSDERLLRYANIVDEQYRRLNRQVEKVLQIAQVEKGTFALKKEWLTLDEILPALLSSAQVRVEENGGQLQTDIPAALPQLLADRLHLSNILYNLLDNAIKYSPAAPHISVRAEQQERQLLLSISDRGVGISKEFQHRVFDKFFRVPTGNVHNVKGFGLGLFYVRQICEAHGWRIQLQSEPGGGTTVLLRFPLRKATRSVPKAMPA